MFHKIPVILFLLICGAVSFWHVNTEYSINEKLLVIHNDTLLSEIDLSNMKKTNFSAEEYSKKLDSTLALKKIEQDSSGVFAIKNGVKKLIFKTKEHIWNEPIILGENIFFIGSITDDPNDKAYIYRFSKGKLSKYINMSVDNGSRLISNGKYLIFVKESVWKENTFYEIVCNDILTNKMTAISSGRFPFWKDDGKNLLFSPLDKESYPRGLVELNLMTKKTVIHDKNLTMDCTTVYNRKHNIALIWADVPNGFLDSYTRPCVPYIYDLNSHKKIEVSKYASFKTFDSNKLNEIYHFSDFIWE